MVISEFLADPPAGLPEFVELVNSGGTPLDVRNWTLSDGTSLRHQFPSGSHCPEHGGVVVWAGSAPPPTPVTEVTFFKASTSGLSLNNTGDVLQLRNAASNLIERVVYRTTDLGSGSSLTRANLPDGPFRPHRALSLAPWSVGTAPDGEAWSPAILATQSPSHVRIVPDPSGQLRLEWQPEPGRLARVSRTADLLDAFEVIGENLADGTFQDVSPTARGFYRVEWQP